jgi:transglutaminase-like putative cysteine protease
MMLSSLALCAALCAQDAKAQATTPPTRSFRFVYSAALPEVAAGARQARLWIPVPVETPDQKITNLMVQARLVTDDTAAVGSIMARTPDKLADSARDGISFTVRDIQGGSGRSLCVETAGKPVSVELSFDVERHETKGGGQASAAELEELKQADKMIPLTGKVAAVAAALPDAKDPRATVRALYEHTLERMKYDKPEAGGWGRGDAEWACDAKFGNCTDFHSYFMGLARTKGIAARFEMGFSIPNGAEKEAKVGGYHCWAYAWVEGHGWLPVDISEADKNPARAEYFFGTLDADRVTMTGGRDLTLEPAPAEGTLNFFVYPYGEVDGKKADNVTKAFKRINP